jgi:hypothetical protein
VVEEKGVPGARKGRRVAGRYPPYDHHDVELATVDAEWSEEEDGLHQMRDIRLPPPAVNGQTVRR